MRLYVSCAGKRQKRRSSLKNAALRNVGAGSTVCGGSPTWPIRRKCVCSYRLSRYKSPIGQLLVPTYRLREIGEWTWQLLPEMHGEFTIAFWLWCPLPQEKLTSPTHHFRYVFHRFYSSYLKSTCVKQTPSQVDLGRRSKKRQEFARANTQTLATAAPKTSATSVTLR